MERGNPEEKLGQVFIDTATDHRLLWPTKNIDNLIFLIRHGGTKIDRVCSEALHDGINNFFRLLVRQVQFETSQQELLNSASRYLEGLTKFFFDVLPVADLVYIILLYL